MSNGNTLDILNQENTKSLVVPKPTAVEQAEIARVLRVHDELEAGVLQKVRRSIELLNYYRAATITAAVTGQIVDLQ
jgi:hypothetical protein